jgi:hypothetical protein
MMNLLRTLISNFDASLVGVSRLRRPSFADLWPIGLQIKCSIMSVLRRAFRMFAFTFEDLVA